MIGTRRFWFWRRAVLRRLQRSYLAPVIALGALVLASTSLTAQDAPEPGEQGAAPASDCADAPDHRRLTEALRQVVAPGDPEPNGGLGNHMWAVAVNRAGVICTVTHSGESFGDQWPGSRTIAAEKAFTANAFSLPGFALSTANLFWPAQPENSLYALATSNPVHEEAFYVGEATSWGTADDPVVGRRLGGTTVFGGGLALYDQQGELVGGLGVSGDESCTDHIVAWKVRHVLNLDHVPAGVTKADDDNIVHDLSVDPGTGRLQSAGGYGHPTCGPSTTTIAQNLSERLPTGPEE
jgi:uncharacterized protein GlcG (DUF336 family)